MSYLDEGTMKANYVEEPSEGARSTVVAVSGVLAALVAILTFIIIPMPAPIGGFDASSILVLSLPIILGVELGTIIVCIGEFVGTAFLVATGLAYIYYLPGIVAVRGLEALLVGKIARSSLFGHSGESTRQVVAAAVGPVWETGGFIAADFYLYYLLAGPTGAIVASISLLTTLIDLLWVPFAMLVVSAARQAFRTSRLDEQMGLKNDKTKRGLYYTCVLFILICWILLFLIPFVFTSWFHP
jgi:uncharacterized membrane protein